MYRVTAAVSLRAIAENALSIKKYSHKKLIAVVKDDAYGHGAAAVAHALEGIADAFAVASVEEGASLRTAGIARDILVLSPCMSAEEGVRLIGYNLIASITSPAAFNVLKKAEDIAGMRVRAHLAVNTGMNRYGVRPALVAHMCALAGDRIEGVYTHLYAPEDNRSLCEQVRLFRAAADTVKGFFPDAVSHIAATGGAVRGAGGDALRVGLALYGYAPATYKGKVRLKRAMKVYAVVSHRCRPIGSGAGYMRVRKQYESVHTLRLGYGDGFFRAGGLGIGKLCMDACVREGDATFGARRLVMSDARAYAQAHGTSEYEVLVAIGAHAEKVYDR